MRNELFDKWWAERFEELSADAKKSDARFAFEAGQRHAPSGAPSSVGTDLIEAIALVESKQIDYQDFINQVRRSANKLTTVAPAPDADAVKELTGAAELFFLATPGWESDGDDLFCGYCGNNKKYGHESSCLYARLRNALARLAA